MGLHSVKLQYPVTMGERTVSELVFHRPTTADFIATDGCAAGSVEADCALVSSLTGEAFEIIRKIDLDDWAEIRPELEMVWNRYFGLAKKKAEQQPEQTEH